MIVPSSDIFAQGIDAPQIRFACHRHAKPGVFQVGMDVQKVRTLREKEKLMLRVPPEMVPQRKTAELFTVKAQATRLLKRFRIQI